MLDNLKPGAVKPVLERTLCDKFENGIREFGIGNACEYFCHTFDSTFTKDLLEDLATDDLFNVQDKSK